jgi:uncharacterized protein
MRPHCKAYLPHNSSMIRQTAIATLKQHKSTLVSCFAVRDIALFGSTVRDEASEISDLDLLVSFDGTATSAKYFGLQFYLEDLMQCSIDLVTDKALRPELKPYIHKDAIHV